MRLLPKKNYHLQLHKAKLTGQGRRVVCSQLQIDNSDIGHLIANHIANYYVTS